MRTFTKIIIRFYYYIKNKNYTTLAGSIAFFFLMNGGAMLFLVFFVFKLFNIEIIVNENNSNLITQTIKYIEEVSNESYEAFSLILIITSIWSSSTLFYHLIKAGEIIYDVKRKKYHMVVRVLSIVMVFIFLILMLTAVILMILGNYILSQISNKGVSIFIEIIIYLGLPLSVILFFFVFVPPVKVKLSEILPGTALTLFYWVIATFLFRIYLKIFVHYKQIYGALTFLVISSIWLYLLCQGLIIGLCLNEKKWQNNQIKIEDNKNGGLL